MLSIHGPKRVSAHNGGAVGERKSEDKHEKPVFFDIAFNYVEPPMEKLRRRAGLPALEGEIGTSGVAAKAKVETEEQQQQKLQLGAGVAPNDDEKKNKASAGGGLAGFLGRYLLATREVLGVLCHVRRP